LLHNERLIFRFTLIVYKLYFVSKVKTNNESCF